MLIIAERINSSRKPISQAISSRDAVFIQNEAKAQTDAGAHFIDVNAGIFMNEETECLKWLIETVQEVTDLPLSIDSPDPGVIRAVLPLVKKPPLINSVTLEPVRLQGLLPLVAGYKAKVIALCQSENAMGDTAEDKLGMAGELVEKITAAGVPIEDIFIDPLVYPLSTSTQSASATLSAIEKIMSRFPGVHTTMGLTNVSHGLPNRKLINRTFLVAAIVRGLNSAIMDPTDRRLYGAMKVAWMVAGKDDFCMEYIMAHREGRLE